MIVTALLHGSVVIFEMQYIVVAEGVLQRQQRDSNMLVVEDDRLLCIGRNQPCQKGRRGNHHLDQMRFAAPSPTCN